MSRTVAVCMICKNEEAMIGRALESVKSADAIYILDTGSQDRTVEISRQYTDNVFLDFVWTDSFCDAQNFLLNKVRGKEDFILSLDADEYVHDFSEVRRAVELATTDMIRVQMVAEGSLHMDFGFGRLFRNSPDIYWIQPAHKHLNISGEGELVGNVKITFGFSPAHRNDPDRTLRILERAVADEGDAAGRNLYYLGREYWYKRRYKECTATLGRYVQVSGWPAEKAEAFLVMSQCYSAQGLDEDARDAVLQAIKINPNFREAVQWMADISTPENSLQWKRMARTANNRDILWDRMPAKPVHDIILLSPHNDDETLFAAYTLMRLHPLVIIVTDSYIQPNRNNIGYIKMGGKKYVDYNEADLRFTGWEHECIIIDRTKNHYHVPIERYYELKKIPLVDTSAETRRQETIAAMKLVGCPVVFLGIKDTELTEENLRERLQYFNPETIYIPAIHEGGNEQHNLVGKVGLELFGRNNVERYCTYVKGDFNIVQGGWEVKPIWQEMELKNKMLDCYTSQLNLKSTKPHFDSVRGTSEWLI